MYMSTNVVVVSVPLAFPLFDDVIVVVVFFGIRAFTMSSLVCPCRSSTDLKSNETCSMEGVVVVAAIAVVAVEGSMMAADVVESRGNDGDSGEVCSGDDSSKVLPVNCNCCCFCSNTRGLGAPEVDMLVLCGNGIVGVGVIVDGVATGEVGYCGHCAIAVVVGLSTGSNCCCICCCGCCGCCFVLELGLFLLLLLLRLLLLLVLLLVLVLVLETVSQSLSQSNN